MRVDRLLLPAATLLLASCQCEDGYARSEEDGNCYPIAAAAPPATTTRGFAFDTEQQEVGGVVNDGGELRIVGRLGSPGGQRSLVVIDGAAESEVKDVTWVLPPVAAVGDSGSVFACWSRLTGAEPASDLPPTPAEGIGLECRYRSGGAWSDTLTVAGSDAPAWLQNVKYLGGTTFRVSYFADPAGSLIGPTMPGSGEFYRDFDGVNLGAPSPQ
ncbi:MAG: hypothetical protein Q8P18_12975 [Pseudomonadota bacterium]|nr:hypothetical protein [Pseudomonadota bacterium]